MRRAMRLPTVLLSATIMVLSMGCSGDEPAVPSGDTVAGSSEELDAGNQGSTADNPAIPEIDFQETGEEFVAAIASGDCEAAVDLKKLTGEANRSVAISNCQLVTQELGDLGEPVWVGTREERQDDGDVVVWVTRDYPGGDQWEMSMTFTDRSGEGWAVGTFAYGFTRRAP